MSLERLRRDWKALGALGVATAIILAASLGTRVITSLPVATVVLLPLLVGTLAGLLVALDERPADQDVQGLRNQAEQGRRLAIYDRETGLYAHWYFSLRLQEEMARSDRSQEPFALLLVEAARGRVAPDTEKRLFSCMKDGFRRADLVAHLGNLRFVALLPNSGTDQGEVVSQRIRGTLGTNEIHVGLACYPADGTDWPTLLQAAESYPQAA